MKWIPAEVKTGWLAGHAYLGPARKLPYGPNRFLSHYEVVVAVHPADSQFLTIDPASGPRVRSWADLDAEWRPAGRPALVVLGPAQQRDGAAQAPRGARDGLVAWMEAAGL